MANITAELNNIANAEAGEDVRWSIHDGIKKINDGTVADNQKNRTDITKIANDGISQATNLASTAVTAANAAKTTAEAANTKATEAVNTANAAKKKVDNAWNVNQSEKSETMWDFFSFFANKKNVYTPARNSGNIYNALPGKIVYLKGENARFPEEYLNDIITGAFELVQIGTIFHHQTYGWTLTVVDLDHRFSSRTLETDNLTDGHYATCLLGYHYSSLRDEWKNMLINRMYFGGYENDEIKIDCSDRSFGYLASYPRALGYELILPIIRETFGNIFINYAQVNGISASVNAPIFKNRGYRGFNGYIELPTLIDVGINVFSNSNSAPFKALKEYLIPSGWGIFDTEIQLQDLYPTDNAETISGHYYLRKFGGIGAHEITHKIESSYFLVNVGNVKYNVADTNCNWWQEGYHSKVVTYK